MPDYASPTRLSVGLGPLGRLNVFGLYYGLTSVGLGLVWLGANFATWITYNFFWRVLRLKAFDKGRRAAIFLAHVWGTALMRLTRCYPVVDVLEGAPAPKNVWSEKEGGTSVMYVANHCSWMDIPYMGAAIGWRNYKIVAKKEVRMRMASFHYVRVAV